LQDESNEMNQGEEQFVYQWSCGCQFDFAVDDAVDGNEDLERESDVIINERDNDPSNETDGEAGDWF
jgi:hypothetical protein